VFVEDCYFLRNIHGIASNNGSRYVFRYNQVYDCLNRSQGADAHGLEFGSLRGSRSYEIYENYISNSSAAFSGIWIRGGDGVIFNNEIINASNGILLSNTTQYPGNSFTYPVTDQIRELYAWGNTKDSIPCGTVVLNGHEHLIQLNRDFFYSEMSNYVPYKHPHPLTQYTPEPTPTGSPSMLPTPTPSPTPGISDWYSRVSFSQGIHTLGSGNTGTQEVEFDFAPYDNNIDGVIGYAGYETNITGYASFSFIVRANTNGYFDVYNYNSYHYTNQLFYGAGTTYHVRIQVNMTTETYSVWITPEGGAEVLIADNYTFRAATPDTDNIGKVGLISDYDNDFGVSNHLVNGNPAPTPPPTPTPIAGSWYSRVNFSEGTHVLGEGNTGTQDVEFDFVPNNNNIDGVIGYAGYETSVTQYASFSFMLRANTSGYFDAYNYNTYNAVNQLPYSAYNLYHARMLVDMTAQTYSAWVAPEGGAETVIAENFAFRAATMPKINNIGKVGLISDYDNDFSVSNHIVTEYNGGTPTPTPTPTPISEESWTASTEYSSTQGDNQWYYKQWDGSIYSDMTWNSGNGRWVGAQTSCIIGNNWQHPGTNDSVRVWDAPYGGAISITGTAKKQDITGGDGVIVTIKKNGNTLWGPQAIAYNDNAGYMHNVQTEVAQGDLIYFIVNKDGSTSYDSTSWDPTITISGTTLTLTPTPIPTSTPTPTPEETWTASTGYSLTQGNNQWHYRQWNGSAYTDMAWNSGSNRWVGDQTSCILGNNWQHPGANDSVRVWEAPYAGTITIAGTACKQNTGGGDGVIVSIKKNDVVLWGSQVIAYDDTVGYTHNIQTEVVQGDLICFIVNKNGTTSYDSTFWDPIITIYQQIL
jgi:hypothetical protein